MDKEVIVYIQNGILLSHKMNTFETNVFWFGRFGRSDEVDESRTYYTESNESETEK